MYHGNAAANAKKGYDRYKNENRRSRNKARKINKQERFTFKKQLKLVKRSLTA